MDDTNAGQERKQIRWVPLEANPDVLNALARKIGVDLEGSNFAFQDVFGLDETLLGFLPRPVLAVILLYPLTPEREAVRVAALAARECDDDYLAEAEGLFYMKQTIGNACGTIALLHCLANVCGQGARGAGGEGEAREDGKERSPQVRLETGGFLDTFLRETAGMTPKEIGSYLEQGNGCSGLLHGMHGEAAQDGETRAPGVDEEINLHFVAFVENGGILWELDGRRAGPVRRGEVADGLIESVARVVQTEYIEGGDGNVHFNLIALARSDEM